MKRIVFSLACLLAALLAHGGTVRTRDGKSYEGAVKLNAEGFAVTLADNSTVKVAFANVERATFEPFAPEPALAGATNGFLGTYFPEPDFGGQPIRRVDASLDFDWSDAPPVPNFPREKFSARWTAQLRPTTTDLYTFHVRVDDGVRLWLNERLLLDEWREQSLSAATAPVTLKASETYNLTIEYFQLTGPARIRFQWSSPTMAKTGIPAELLAPGKVLALPSLAATANIGKGVLTWNGSFIGAPVQRADDTAVVFDAPHKGFVLSTVNAARIYFRALSSSRAAKLEPKRPGVLLINGDFIDGEFKGIADGRVQITSVLFGLKSYDINYEALAVTLRDPVTAQAQFLVRSRAGGALLAQSVAVKDGALEVTGAPVTGLRIAETDLEEFKSGTGTNLWDEVVTKILIRESAADRPTSTDLAGARRVRDEGERMARAAADVRNRAEEKARSETDALARAQTDLEKKSRLAAEAKIAVDATTAEKAKHEKTYNDASLLLNARRMTSTKSRSSPPPQNPRRSVRRRRLKANTARRARPARIWTASPPLSTRAAPSLRPS
ncbi:MAG: hypothetical protein HY300_06445 [Verrucomicrobia bacterium]|nr:hypothetical protein [Verrucomicrobiota bacterium]